MSIESRGIHCILFLFMLIIPEYLIRRGKIMQIINTDHIVTEAMLACLPVPVQRYMRFTGVLGKSWINTVRIRYQGLFRTAPDNPWMPISVQQCYTTNPPGFLWKARFKIAGLPILSGNDIYKAGHSHMSGKLAGLLTVIDGKGEEIDQGTMVRYLQEMTWFPIAYLGDNITWTPVDDHCAEVTLTDSGKTVSARMFFDDSGRLLSFVARRFGDFKEGFVVNTWATPTTEYATFCDLKLPAAGIGVWQLPSGDFPYVNIHLTSVEYNVMVEQF